MTIPTAPSSARATPSPWPVDERTPRAAYLAVELCNWRLAVGGPATYGKPDTIAAALRLFFAQ